MPINNASVHQSSCMSLTGSSAIAERPRSRVG